MKKKFLSVLLCGALILGATGTFTSCKDYQDDIDDLQEQINANQTSLSGLQNQLASLENKAAQLQDALVQAKNTADAAKTAADKAQENAVKAQEDAKNAQTAADKAQAAADAAAAEAKAAAAKAEQAAATAQANAIEEAKNYVDGVKEVLQGQIDDLQKMIDSKVDTAVFNDALISVHSEIDSCMTNVNGKVDALEKSVEDILTDLENIKGQIQTNSDDIAALSLKHDADVLALLEKLNTQNKALEEYEKLTDSTINGINDTINGIKEDIKKLKEEVSQNTKDISELKALFKSLNESIKTINDHLSTLDQQISTLTHRLAGLTFVPTTYYHGIPAITFSSLTYYPWKIDPADTLPKPSTDDTLYIRGETSAVYTVDPDDAVEKVTKDNTTGLFNKAINVKSGSPEPVVLIEDIVPNKGDGTIKVQLKKNTDTKFLLSDNPKEEKFWQMAIRTETDKVIESDTTTQYVTSDWARLFDNDWRPFIHNRKFKDCAPSDAHFYDYVTIHDADPSTTLGSYIVQEIPYKKSDRDTTHLELPFDLHNLVAVCDKAGYIITPEEAENDYGLSFGFKLMEYKLALGSAGPTDQSKFAKIDKEGVIISCVNDTAGKRDAIGREPMIEVRLNKDTNIVDVRYFKIKWIDIPPFYKDLGLLADQTEDWNCSGSFADTIGTDTMNNKVYAVTGEDGQGYSKDQFHSLFTLDTLPYGSPDSAKNGIPSSLHRGKIDTIAAIPGSTTYNIIWNYVDTDTPITDKEYNAGKAERTVWGRFVKKDGTEIYTFCLKLTLNIPQMKMNSGNYVELYWSNIDPHDANKYFTVNPALMSDAEYGSSNQMDCEIITNMMNGYSIVNPSASSGYSNPTNVLQVVSGASEAHLEFDKDRIKEMLGPGWSVSNDMTHHTSWLQYTITTGGASTTTSGALIDVYNGHDAGKGRVFLCEVPDPRIVASTTPGTPTEAAKMLVGKKVPVKLVAKNCAGIERVVDRFLVYFMNPLEIKLGNMSDSFKDLVTGGDTVYIDKIVTIKEAFGLKRDVWKNGAAADAALATWYKLTDVVWDFANAKVNLEFNTAGGVKITDEVTGKLSDFSSYLTVDPDSPANPTYLVYHNHSGAALAKTDKPLKISIPVHAVSKWDPALSDPEHSSIIIEVLPGVWP